MPKPKETKEISGAYISEAHTINSMYAQGKVELVDKYGEYYRIDVSELLKLVQKEKFLATKKAKYYHLTLV